MTINEFNDIVTRIHTIEGLVYKQVRLKVEMTATAVANRVNVSRDKLRKFEQGKNITHAGLLRYALGELYKEQFLFSGISVKKFANKIAKKTIILSDAMRVIETMPHSGATETYLAAKAKEKCHQAIASITQLSASIHEAAVLNAVLAQYEQIMMHFPTVPQDTYGEAA